MKNIWVFGHSICLPFNLKNKKLGWDNIISNKLNIPVKNYAGESSDNFFIYSTICDHIKSFKKNDIIIVGWSHPSRKTFIYDNSNYKQKKALDNSLLLKTKHNTYIRSGSPKKAESFHKWFSMKPRSKGIEYYDNWFKDYYNIQEQRINFQSYLYATTHLLKNNFYFPFYFSKESVIDIDISHKNNIGFILDFIKKNKVYISENDAHLNENGHTLWANKILKKIKTAK